jgi:hypothetical protein
MASSLKESTVHAQAEVVSIGTLAQPVGATGSVTLSALNVNIPPLGAWQVDISYKPVLLTAVECSSQTGTGVCNVAYAKDKVRLVGVKQDGVRGTAVNLATIGFRCNAEGTSPLRLEVETFADTNGFQMPHSVKNGQVECYAASGASPGHTPNLGSPSQGGLATVPNRPSGALFPSVSSGRDRTSFAVIISLGITLGLLAVGGLSFRYVSRRRKGG